uniref:Putative triabin n=1 Tax=Panstrongylus lignarius TaxID=156445 RepID=A0A224XL15_9HEMI
MKTIVAVTFFGILTYAFADTLKYGGSSCQQVTGMVGFDAAKFFSSSWSLSHSTRSKRVTVSTICRDYKLSTKSDGTLQATYGYYENSGKKNHYDIHCNGTKNATRPDQYDFDCYLTNERGEKTHTHIQPFFIATDYEKYCLLYRCVQSEAQFEDNVFILYRQTIPSDDEVTTLLKPYGLTLDDFISRKDATCINK